MGHDNLICYLLAALTVTLHVRRHIDGQYRSMYSTTTSILCVVGLWSHVARWVSFELVVHVARI